MPEPSARRQFPRYPIVLSILYRLKAPASGRAGVGRTQNLSEGGACLELAEPLPPSTPLDVVLQTDRGSIGMEAQVVWAGGPGHVGGAVLHGVAFTQVTPEEQRALRDLIQRQEQVRNVAIRVPVMLSVLCRRKGEVGSPLRGQTGDISRGGLSLRLPRSLPMATAVEITLYTRRGPLTVEGTVVWVEPPEAQAPGVPVHHGLRFTDLGWANELSLGLLLAEIPEESSPSANPG